MHVTKAYMIHEELTVVRGELKVESNWTTSKLKGREHTNFQNLRFVTKCSQQNKTSENMQMLNFYK